MYAGYSLGAHIDKTAPDVIYGYASQLWVDSGDDIWVWVLQLWTSEPPGERFGRHLVL